MEPESINLDKQAPLLTDSVSNIRWINPNQNQIDPTIFATTCWDGFLRIFQVDNIGLFGRTIRSKMTLKVSESPLMDCCWSSDNRNIYVGCGDGKIISVDTKTEDTMIIGQHDSAISSIHSRPDLGSDTIISSAYQKVIKIWQTGVKASVKQIRVSQKVLCSDFNDPIYVCGLNNEKILLFDIKNPEATSSTIECHLGFGSKIQSIAVDKNNKYVGIGSTDGRGSISIIDNLQLKLVMNFKANSQQQGQQTILYPVNSVGFNPRRQQWLMTAGSNGFIKFFDFEAKNRIIQYPHNRVPVCKASVSPTGTMIAFALGNDWHLGQSGQSTQNWKPRISVRKIEQNLLQYQRVR